LLTIIIEGGKLYAGSQTIGESINFKDLTDTGSDDSDMNLEDLLKEAQEREAEKKMHSPLYFAEVEPNTCVAVMDMDPRSTKDNMWEIEKLRGKVIRIYSKKKAQSKGLESEVTDLWVRKLQQERKEFFRDGRVAITQYWVHWQGWANEDDEWIDGVEIPLELKREFDENAGEVDVIDRIHEVDLAKVLKEMTSGLKS
jgi:hypothetical protein